MLITRPTSNTGGLRESDSQGLNTDVLRLHDLPAVCHGLDQLSHSCAELERTHSICHSLKHHIWLSLWTRDPSFHFNQWELSLFRVARVC
jgi:hypothetical protein